MSDNRRLTVNHDKFNDTVLVCLHDSDVSAILRISAEEAESIGAVGTMAKTHRENRGDK